MTTRRKSSPATTPTTNRHGAPPNSANESADETAPLLNLQRKHSGGRQTSVGRQGRRQSLAAIGTGAEFSLPGGSRFGSIDVTNRASSLSAIGTVGDTLANMTASLGSSQSGSKATLVGESAAMKKAALGIHQEETQLYETLFKSLNRRRQSMQKMNSTTASLLMSAAPGLIGASPEHQRQLRKHQQLLMKQQQEQQAAAEKEKASAKKSVRFDFDGAGSDYNSEYNDDDECFDENDVARESQLLLESEKGLDDEERQRRAIERLKRRKENATTARIRKYGYDPLTPPIPKSWAEWSMQRRDYQAALAEVLQCQKQPQLSTAAMKGRKESVAFVKEDLLDVHLNKKQNDGASLLGKKIDSDSKKDSAAAEAKKAKDKKGKTHDHHRHHHQISDAEMETLKAYYYHSLFSGARAIGILSMLSAMALIGFALALPIWFKIPHKLFEPNGPEYLYQLTMLENCTVLLNAADHSLLADLRDFASDIKEAVDHGSMSAMSHSGIANLEATENEKNVALRAQRSTGATPDSLFDVTLEPPSLLGLMNHSFVDGTCERYSFGTWHTFLMGVYVFTTLFGTMALMLSICGTCARSLPKRLYYYHSAAEILFVCGIVALIDTILFPLCIRYKAERVGFSFAHGYYMAAASTVAYLTAAALLNLDTFIMCTIPSTDHRVRKRRLKTPGK